MNKKKLYKIGGKVIEFTYLESTPSLNILLKELEVYDKVNSNNHNIDLNIHYTEKEIPCKATSKNPSSHVEFPGGYLSILSHSDIAYYNNLDKPKVIFRYKNNFKRYLNKFRGMQFTHPFEDVGQIFHEAVLVPSFLHFFSKDLSLIHGSSVINTAGEGVIFAGTGGVGKTTMELELILEKSYKFLADDISILTNDGQIQPNFSFPKIYAYNAIGKPQIIKRLFKNKSFWNKLWWNFQLKLKSPNRVRRRADLETFYFKRIGNSIPLKKIYVLYREEIDEISIENLSYEQLALMNISVLRTEVPVFTMNMNFHEYNQTYLNKLEFSAIQIFENVYNNQKNVFEKMNIESYIVKIPMKMDALTLSKKLPDFLKL